MATKIVTKNSSTASAVPTASDLVQGELAVNVADKRLFTENNAGAIVELGTNPSTLTVTGEITANGGIALGDGDELTLGDSDEFKIKHHASGYTHLQNTVGTLYIDSDSVTFRDDDGSPSNVVISQTGIDVTGTATMDGLTVDGNATFSGSVTTENHFAVIPPTTTNYAYMDYSNAGGSMYVGRERSSASGLLTGSTAYAGVINVTGAYPLEFGTNNSKRMTIDSSGNLLLGGTNTNPTGANVAGIALDASGEINASVAGGDAVRFNRKSDHGDIVRIMKDGITHGVLGTSSGTNRIFDINASTDGASEMRFLTHSGSANVEAMRIDSSGRVRIGTSSTDTGSMLTVAGAATFTGQNTAHGASRLKISQESTAISQFRFYGANTSTAGILQFIGSSSDGTVGGERMRIDASGNLLVGTTNTANLATHTPNVVTDLQYGINDGSNIASFGLDRIHFNSSNYYVLNASSTGVRLINGATSWTTQSDENSKENIVELSNALTAVNAMRCVRYNLKSQTSGDVKIGFIAQDWQSSYPEVVATDTDGILGMNYTETIPVLLKAIQEQQTLIESLTTRIAALEAGE